MAIEKIQILGAVLELPARQHCQSSPFTYKWAKLAKTASRILISLIAVDAECSFYVQSIATYASNFLGIIKNM